MTRPIVEIGLALLTVGFAAAAVRRAGGEEPVRAAVPVPPASPKATASPSPGVLNRARTTLIEQNPFRINRLPGIRAGQPLEPVPASMATVQLANPRPQLIVRAIVGGPPWSAIVEGLPNASGAIVVRAGEVFDWITIGDITRDTLVAAARDTAWRFGVHRSPQ